MLYVNRLKRKQKHKEIKRKLKSTIKNTTNKTLQVLSMNKLLHEEIIEAIKSALDWGLPEVRYYKEHDVVGIASVKNEISVYHLLNETKDFKLTDDLLDYLYEAIIGQVDSYFSRYKDIVLVKGEDENGSFFEVQRVEIQE